MGSGLLVPLQLPLLPTPPPRLSEPLRQQASWAAALAPAAETLSRATRQTQTERREALVVAAAAAEDGASMLRGPLQVLLVPSTACPPFLVSEACLDDRFQVGTYLVRPGLPSNKMIATKHLCPGQALLKHVQQYEASAFFSLRFRSPLDLETLGLLGTPQKLERWRRRGPRRSRRREGGGGGGGGGGGRRAGCVRTSAGGTSASRTATAGAAK